MYHGVVELIEKKTSFLIYHSEKGFTLFLLLFHSRVILMDLWELPCLLLLFKTNLSFPNAVSSLVYGVCGFETPQESKLGTPVVHDRALLVAFVNRGTFTCLL